MGIACEGTPQLTVHARHRGESTLSGILTAFFGISANNVGEYSFAYIEILVFKAHRRLM